MKQFDFSLNRFISLFLRWKRPGVRTDNTIPPSPSSSSARGGKNLVWVQVLFNPRGLSVLFMVVVMSLMVTIGYLFSYLIPTKQKAVVLAVSSNQAFFLAQSGVEFAVRYATINGLGSLSAPITRNLGRGSFTVSYNSSTNRLTSVGQIPNSSERRIVVSNFSSFLISISYFASTSTPADNGANTTNPTVVIPPSNMQAGDLVLMIGASRDSTATLAVSNSGGQTWTSEIQQNQTNCRIRLFWCRFNGTWTANPSVSFGNNNPHIVVMHVFRPSNTSSIWQVDAAQVSGNYAAPSSPFTVTIPGITTVTDGALVFATWASTDNNTWGSLTAGWTTPGSAQYRTTSGSDLSQTHAYRIMTTAGPTGNVSKNQATLGGDAGAYLIIAFRALII